MKPRCSWSGYLKISLVTVPVRVYTAISRADKITFNQLHKTCHQRLKQKLVCPVHGEVERADLEKGYEFADGQFVTLTEPELDAVRLESTGTIELVQFVRADELDPMFLDTPYFVGPDGPVAEEGFRVLREALRRTKRLGIGQVVLNGKERLLVIKPHGRGLLMFTLRYAAEVRAAALYFDDLADQPVDSAQLALAQKLIESKSTALNLAGFTDRYQAAVLELIKNKIEGTAPVLVPRSDAAQVVNLMEALRQSVAQAEPTSKRNGQVRGNGQARNNGQARRNGHKRLVLAA